MARSDERTASGQKSMKAWTAAFTYQYERFRRRCPDKPLLVVFDIDGTIVDVRYTAMHAMRAYDHSRESEGILASNVPRRGVLDFMRWFQSQPAAHIAVNTARLEAHRQETMSVLDILGRAFGVRFHPHLIQMRSDAKTAVQTAKMAGLRRFKRDGFKVIAVADSDHENIAAIHKSAGFWDENLYLESLVP